MSIGASFWGARIPRTAPLDRAAFWFIAIVLALTWSLGIQTLAWMWGDPTGADRHSPWGMLHAIAWVAGRQPWLRALMAAGAVLVALAFAGLVLRRRLGLVLALPCSTLLLSLGMAGRYLAIFQEPKQFVAKSMWVQASTALVLGLFLTHGVAALASLRLLRRSPAAPMVTRAGLPLLALAAAPTPILWLLYLHHESTAATTTGIALATSAAIFIALVTAARPTLKLAFLALLVLGAALVTDALCILAVIGERWRHALYSPAAASALMHTVISAPSLVALFELVRLLRSQLTLDVSGDTADHESEL